MMLCIFHAEAIGDVFFENEDFKHCTHSFYRDVMAGIYTLCEVEVIELSYGRKGKICKRKEIFDDISKYVYRNTRFYLSLSHFYRKKYKFYNGVRILRKLPHRIKRGPNYTCYQRVIWCLRA